MWDESDSEAPTGDASDELIGQVLDERYLIQVRIARGGMGKIYRAKQIQNGRTVAVKIFAPTLTTAGAQFEKRFRLEASASAQLNHPNTVRIYEYGVTSDDGIYYIAMEFLDGQTLKSLLEQKKYLAAKRAIRLARQICGALGEAHDKGIVHRDLKPSNIMLVNVSGHDDFVKVLDFGLVKPFQQDEELTQSGQIVGSPMYMSPEQVRGGKLDGRSDVYALGVVLYTMITGVSPFPQQGSARIMLSHLQTPPAPFEKVAPERQIPESLQWVILTALEKAPNDRFANMAEMNVALRACERELSGAFTTKVRFRLDRGRTIVNDTSILPTGRWGRIAIGVSFLLVGSTLIAIGALIANALMMP